MGYETKEFCETVIIMPGLWVDFVELSGDVVLVSLEFAERLIKESVVMSFICPICSEIVSGEEPYLSLCRGFEAYVFHEKCLGPKRIVPNPKFPSRLYYVEESAGEDLRGYKKVSVLL